MAASLSDEIKEQRAREDLARIDANIARTKEEYAAALACELTRLKTERRSAAKYVAWFVKRRAQARYWKKTQGEAR